MRTARPTVRISIHAPREGSDADRKICSVRNDNFNPRSPRGERPFFIYLSFGFLPFQSTLPARGATRAATITSPQPPFQSTLPARGATLENYITQAIQLFQSTLPARGATTLQKFPVHCSLISIHAPREGSDLSILRGSMVNVTFQSTLPARGATPEEIASNIIKIISIHAPREGSDQIARTARPTVRISIHAPREGSDFFYFLSQLVDIHFNPRSPRGERLETLICFKLDFRFQSTLPARGATRFLHWSSSLSLISIHAPREGSDHHDL